MRLSTLTLTTTLILSGPASAGCLGDYGCDSITGRYPGDSRSQVDQTLRWNSDLQRQNDYSYQRSFEMNRQMNRDLDRYSDRITGRDTPYTPSWRR